MFLHWNIEHDTATLLEVPDCVELLEAGDHTKCFLTDVTPRPCFFTNLLACLLRLAAHGAPPCGLLFLLCWWQVRTKAPPCQSLHFGRQWFTGPTHLAAVTVLRDQSLNERKPELQIGHLAAILLVEDKCVQRSVVQELSKKFLVVNLLTFSGNRIRREHLVRQAHPSHYVVVVADYRRLLDSATFWI